MILRGNGARNRVRTGDLNLGKVALYQLSYSRIVKVPRKGRSVYLRRGKLSSALMRTNHSGLIHAYFVKSWNTDEVLLFLTRERFETLLEPLDSLMP